LKPIEFEGLKDLEKEYIQDKGIQIPIFKTLSRLFIEIRNGNKEIHKGKKVYRVMEIRKFIRGRRFIESSRSFLESRGWMERKP